MNGVAPQADREECARDVRSAVVRTIETLGAGFLSADADRRLHDRLESGELTAKEFYRQLVCVTYRVVILLIAEERDLLHTRDTGRAARLRYKDAYSLRRLHVGAVSSEQHAELWRSLCFVFDALGSRAGCPRLGLEGICTYLWSYAATPDVHPGEETRGELEDDVLRAVVRDLASLEWSGGGERDAQVLGAVYESLLELIPEIDLDSNTFVLTGARENERRTSGSFYTPEPLVEHLLDSALEPVVEERLSRANSESDTVEAAILSIRVCDPSCGCGHFLVAAARRLAKRLTQARGQDSATAESEFRQALSDVIGSCIYGVDLNPMAAELCKIALWLETREPVAALSRFDSRIKVGNSLLGATAGLVAQGIPDQAFSAQDGEDAERLQRVRRRNNRERQEQVAERTALCAEPVIQAGTTSCATAGNRDDSCTGLARERALCDAWCAAFMWPGDDDEPLTHGVLRMLESDPDAVAGVMKDKVGCLKTEYGFFHWHLEFPDVFGSSARDEASEAMFFGRRPSDETGFDVVIGNPPFQNQLESVTAAARGPAALLRARSGGAVRGYADFSAAFLLLSASIVRDGGRVAMVQPQSLLATKDAGAVRGELLRRCALTSLWVSNEHVFDGASVYTCAPTLHAGGTRRGELRRSCGGAFTSLNSLHIDNDSLARDETWAHLGAAASGVPEFSLKDERCVRDIAIATADFRDQYYGLDGFLIEDDEVDAGGDERDRRYPPVVTTGLIDPAACRWGEATTRILKHRWRAPRVDRARMEREGDLSAWIEARRVPKVLVATQTRVIEAYADSAGRFVPSTPLVSVMPNSDADIWRLAAAVASPVCTAIAMQRYAGAALNASAIKLSAKQVMRLPLPQDAVVWEQGAALYREAHETCAAGARQERLILFGRRMCGAYGIGGSAGENVFAWWTERLNPSRKRRVGGTASGMCSA